MHVAVAGPCSPAGLLNRIHPDQVDRASVYPGFGGTAVIALVDALVGLGHTVTVVTTGEPGAPPARFSGQRLDILCLPRRPAGRAIRDMYRQERWDLAMAIRNSGAQLVNSHWTYEFALAAIDSGLPHVTTARDAPLRVLRYNTDPYRAARLIVAARVRTQTRWLSCVSPYLARNWSTDMLYRRPIEVIPNPIPSDVIGVPRTPSQQPTILDVADSGRLKNVESLLRAAASVRRHIPTLEVRLVGPGLGAEDAFATWARERALATGVRFLGALDRTALRSEFSRAWLFVHASLEESFGMSVLEAAAAGLPVVAGRRTGGIPYVLGQGRAGWLADVGNPERLASAIRPLLTAAPPEPKPGTREYLETTFGPSRVAEQYVQWYRSALGGETPD